MGDGMVGNAVGLFSAKFRYQDGINGSHALPCFGNFLDDGAGLLNGLKNDMLLRTPPKLAAVSSCTIADLVNDTVENFIVHYGQPQQWRQQ